MMYSITDNTINFSLTQIEFDALLHGIDMSNCEDSDFLNVRDLLCGIWDRIR